MCWNFEVSVMFAAIEAVSIFVIYRRARRSADPYVQAQVLLLPGLIGIMLVETCEALIWLDEENLIRVNALLGEPPACSKYNSALTFVLWMILIPTQPILAIYPLRRVGDPKNYDKLFISEIVAIVYYFSHVMCYLIVQFMEVKYPWYFKDLPREKIMANNYKSFANRETCSYIGTHHHLFWTLNTSEDWVTPNAFSYFLCSIPMLFAKPWRFGGAFSLPMGLGCLYMAVIYHRSVEVASVWCWTGILAHMYILIQPYLLPCSGYNYVYHRLDCNNAEGNKVLKTKTSAENGLDYDDEEKSMLFEDNGNIGDIARRRNGNGELELRSIK